MTSMIFGLLTVLATFGFLFFMKKRLNTQYAHMRASEVATRLGMQLVEGNPEHNLVTMSVQPVVTNIGSARGFLKQMAVGQVGGKLGEHSTRMVGSRNGMPLELRIYCAQELEVGASQDTTFTRYDIRLSVETRQVLPSFELRLRRPMTGLETKTAFENAALPAVPLADPALEAKLLLETASASLGRQLAPLFAPLGSLPYVHVVGSARRISFVMTPSSLNTAAMSLESILQVLVAIGAALDGPAGASATGSGAQPYAVS